MKSLFIAAFSAGDPSGNRTPDTLIKRNRATRESANPHRMQNFCFLSTFILNLTFIYTDITKYKFDMKFRATGIYILIYYTIPPLLPVNNGLFLLFPAHPAKFANVCEFEINPAKSRTCPCFELHGRREARNAPPPIFNASVSAPEMPHSRRIQQLKRSRQRS